MGQHSVPEPEEKTEDRTEPSHAPRGARAGLGRAVAAPPSDTPTGGVVLILPTGVPVSDRGPSPLTRMAARPMARALAGPAARLGVVVHVVRYRVRGWNGADAALSADARWAADEVERRYGDVPVCLVGQGMGGRAALHAAGHPAVTSAIAIAPWLPDDDIALPQEPVRQLVGRQVLIVHGTDDARSDPELSFRLAERAKKVNRDTCRFEVHTDGHSLRHHHSEVTALARDFALGSLLSRGFSRPVADALAAPPPLGLRMPLAAGFGRTLGQG